MEGERKGEGEGKKDPRRREQGGGETGRHLSLQILSY